MFTTYYDNPDLIQYHVTRPPVSIADTDGKGMYNISPIGFPVRNVSGELGVNPTLIIPEFSVGYADVTEGGTSIVTDYTSYNTNVASLEGYQTFTEELTSITFSTTTATVTSIDKHGYTNGLDILITGATEALYNGTFTISNVTDYTFEYTMPGTPLVAAMGLIRSSFTLSDSSANITLQSQLDSNTNGFYTSNEGPWAILVTEGSMYEPIVAYSSSNIDLGTAVTPYTISHDIDEIAGDGTLVEVKTVKDNGYQSGSTVTIAGTANFDGTYTITSSTLVSFTFELVTAVVSETVGTANYDVQEGQLVNLVAQTNVTEKGIYTALSTGWEFWGCFYVWDGTENDNVEGVYPSQIDPITGEVLQPNHYRRGYSNEEVTDWLRSSLETPIEFGKYRGMDASNNKQGALTQWLLSGRQVNIGGQGVNKQVWVQGFGLGNSSKTNATERRGGDVNAQDFAQVLDARSKVSRYDKQALWGLTNHASRNLSGLIESSPYVKDYPFIYNSEYVEAQGLISGGFTPVDVDVERWIMSTPTSSATNEARTLDQSILYYLRDNSYHNNITLDMNNPDTFGRHSLVVNHTLENQDAIPISYQFFNSPTGIDVANNTIELPHPQVLSVDDVIWFKTDMGSVLPDGIVEKTTYYIESIVGSLITLKDKNNVQINLGPSAGSGISLIVRLAFAPYSNYDVKGYLDDLVDNAGFSTSIQIIARKVDGDITSYYFAQRPKVSLDDIIPVTTGWTPTTLTYDAPSADSIRVYLESTETDYVVFTDVNKTTAELLQSLKDYNNLIPMPFDASTDTSTLQQLFVYSDVVDYTDPINNTAKIRSKKTFVHLPTPTEMDDGVPLELDVSVLAIPNTNPFQFNTVGSLSGYRNYVTQPRVYVMGGAQELDLADIVIDTLVRDNNVATVTTITNMDTYTTIFDDTDVLVEFNQIKVVEEYRAGEKIVIVKGSGSLPSGLTDGETYVIATSSAYRVTLEDTLGNPVSLIDTGSGEHRIVRKAGVIICISGADQEDYNGRFNGIVTSRNTIEYNINTTAGVSTETTEPGGTVVVTSVVSTFAGDGSYGDTEGAGDSASFRYPRGIAQDSLGNLYVSDNLNKKIRKITPAGDVSTFAGSGTQGDANGTGTAAEFNNPAGIVIDSSDNLYIADTNNNKIRKITPAGEVTTFAGTGTQGDTNGSGTTATFDHPWGIALDSLNNLYVADRLNNKIRKITPAGDVSTFAGASDGSSGDDDGTGASAKFNNPYGIILDSSDNVYVGDTNNNKIRKITPAGEVSTFAGASDGSSGDDDGAGASAEFNNPRGMSIDSSNNIYVVDVNNRKIRRITPAGVVSSIAGDGSSGDDNGPGDIAEFSAPRDVVVDSSDNILYVADYNNNKIRKLVLTQTINSYEDVITFAGPGATGAAASATFDNPFGIDFDSLGNMYVADSDNNKIHKITPSGVVSTFAGSGSYGDADGPGSSASFRRPRGLAVDASGNVYVAERFNYKIRKITPSGVVSTFAGSGSSGNADGTGTGASFNYPFGVAIDSSNNIYVTDVLNHKIRKITPAGVVSTLAGTGSQGSNDGAVASATFNQPHGIALDSSNNIYVGDFNNNKIRKITPSGVVSTIAGTGTQGHTDGEALDATFYNPGGLVLDSSNNIYVADISNRKIRMITPSGTVITIAGDGNIGSDDGVVDSASFNNPWYLAIDSSDNIYVADTSNDNIRKIQRAADVSTMVTSATGSIVINQLVRAEGADGTKGLTERRNTSIFGSTPENEFSSTDNAYHQTFTSNNVLGLGLDKRVLLATVYPTNTSTFAWRIDNDPHMRMLQWSLLNVNAAGGSSDTGSFAKVAYQRNLDIKTHFGANYFNFGINDNPLSYSTTLTPDENQQQLAAYLRVLLPPKLSPQTEGELLTDDEFNTVGSYTYQGSTAMGELVTDFVNGRVRVESRDDNSAFESDSLTFQHGYDANHGSLDIPTSFFDQNPGQEFVQYNTMQLPSSTSSNGYRWITKGLYNPEYVVNAENNTVQTTLDSYEGTSSAFKSYLSYYFITDAERENNAGNRYVPGELNPVTDPSWEFSVDNKQSFIKFLISNDEDNVLVNDVRRSFWDSYYTIPEGEDRQIQNIFQINNTDSVSDITQFHGMYWLPFARIFSSDYEVPPEINITDIDDYASIIGGAYPNVASTLGKSLKSNPIAQRFYEDGYDESFVSVNTNNVTNVALEEFLRNYINGYSNLMPYRFYNNFRTIITSTDTPTQNNQDTSLNQITTEMDVDRIYKFTTRDYLEQYSDVPPSSEIGRYIDDNFTFTQDGAVASTVIAEDYNPAWMYFDNGNPTTDPENSTIKNLIVVSGQNYIADREFYREKMLYNYTRVKLKFVFSRKSGRWMTLDYRQVPTSYLTPTIGSVALDEKEQSVFVSNKTENTLSNYVQSIVPKINTIYDVTQLPSNDGIFDSVTFISNSDTPIYSVAEKVMLYVPQHVTELNSPQDPTLNIYSVVDSYGDIVDVGGGKYSHTIELNDALNTLLEISNLRIASQLDTIVEGSYPFNNVTQGPNIDFIWNRDKCQDSTNLYRQLETTPYYLMEPNELNRGVLPYMSPSFPYDANGDRVSELNPEVDSTGAEDYRFQRLLEPQKGAPDGINYVVPNNIHGGSIDADENLFLFQPHTWTTYWHIRPCVSCMEGTDIPTRTAYTSGVMADPVLNNMFTWPDPRNIQYAIPWHKDMAQSWFNNGLLIIDAERVTFNGCNSLIIDAALSDPENVPPRFPYDIYDADRYTLGL